jgi:hypothetical protein
MQEERSLKPAQMQEKEFVLRKQSLKRKILWFIAFTDWLINMEFEFGGNKIVFEKELSSLDKLVLRFVKPLQA